VCVFPRHATTDHSSCTCARTYDRYVPADVIGDRVCTTRWVVHMCDEFCSVLLSFCSVLLSFAQFCSVAARFCSVLLSLCSVLSRCCPRCVHGVFMVCSCQLTADRMLCACDTLCVCDMGMLFHDDHQCSQHGRGVTCLLVRHCSHVGMYGCGAPTHTCVVYPAQHSRAVYSRGVYM
jgi:hypothetical protein